MECKILIADDDTGVRNVLSAILEAEGFKVIAAEDGVAAVKLAKAELPQLILLDIKMPLKDGLQACREIKADPETRHIPIVMLSSAGQLAEIETALKLGAASYITKPCDRQPIIEAAKSVINPAPKAKWLKAKRKSRRNPST